MCLLWQDKRGTEKEMVNIQEIKEMYTTGIRAKLYGLEQNEMRDKLRKTYKDLIPESTFEFGCNVGMNIKDLPNHYGIDINNEAILKGRELGINVYLGDEKELNVMPDNSYELVMTSSILDHIPDENFKEIFTNLKRITSKYLVCLETNDELDIDLFAHDYSSMTPLWEYHSKRPKGNNANYTCYLWIK